MFYQRVLTRLNGYYKKWNGSTIITNIESLKADAAFINRIHTGMQGLDSIALRLEAGKLRQRINAGEKPEMIMPEMFALVKEIIIRHLGLTPFDEQLIAAIAMQRGYIAEMQTGEGKTLAAVFTVCLNALSGNGVHVLTFNDYLAKRDALWMMPVYTELGLSTAWINQGMSAESRRAAYNADITYLTAKEAGFDYLRDNLCYAKNDRVQRPLQLALIDEADSILIDEARIPLVIAGEDIDDAGNLRYRAADAAQLMKCGHDFAYDEYSRNIILTDSGITTAENYFNCGNLFNHENNTLLAALYCALHAQHLLRNDVDYLIRDCRIELIDEFTGRIAEKRRWPDGIQEALEIKEGLIARPKGRILNSITMQHFLRRYQHLCGMTATAAAAESEFRDFYDLHIVVVPTHKKCIRHDAPDVVFADKQSKSNALINEIAEARKRRQPVLVGTASVKESIELAKMLSEHGIKTEVLNAQNDESEAEIIAQAGMPGAVTISTNMAGRGTDIKLGGSDGKKRLEAVNAGGLYVIGTNKHESRRIDQQLRGRAGRQGDPGISRFFISLEDDLCVKYRLRDLLPDAASVTDNRAISDSSILREVNRIQRIVEGQNLEIKKTLFSYSSTVEKQRSAMNDLRNQILESEGILSYLIETVPDIADKLIEAAGEINVIAICRRIQLLAIDELWSRHLASAADLREGIHLNRIGGQNPLFVFRKTIIDLFSDFGEQCELTSADALRKLVVKDGNLSLDATGLKTPSATWTYLVNDNPFEDMIGVQMLNNVSFSANAVLLGPFLAFYYLMKRMRRKSA